MLAHQAPDPFLIDRSTQRFTHLRGHAPATIATSMPRLGVANHGDDPRLLERAP
jgi:hypothetical protein